MLSCHNIGMYQQPVAKAVQTHTRPCCVCMCGWVRECVYSKKRSASFFTDSDRNGKIYIKGKGNRLTVASSSNFPNSSFSSLTSSWAVHWEARLVKPTISANRMLQQNESSVWVNAGLFISESLNSIIQCLITIALGNLLNRKPESKSIWTFSSDHVYTAS